MFRIEEYQLETGWSTLRHSIPEDERAGLTAANAEMLWDGESEPVAWSVRLVDEV